jgi:hypothetical protein
MIPDPDELQQLREKRRELQSAFRTVFTGIGGALVLEHLRQSAGTRRPVFRRQEDGRLDPIAAAHTDGRRSIVLEIEDILAEEEDGEVFTAPEIKG